MNTKTRHRSQRLPVTLSEAEAQALLAQVYTTSTTGLRNRTMLQVMLGAGLRVSEVVNLRGVDVDLEAGTLRVNLGKGAKDRVVPVDAETRGWLRAWAEKRASLGLNGRAPFFFGLRTRTTTKGYRALSTRYVQQLVAVLAAAAGIQKRVSPHTLRHTYATRLLNHQGFNLREVQTLLGHANVATTQIYTHVEPEALRAKVQQEAPATASTVAPQPAEAEPSLQALAQALSKLKPQQRAALARAIGGDK